MIFLISENYTPLLDIPTSVTLTSATCLDHIYVKFIENFFTGALQTSISDHYATFCCIPNWIGRIINVSKYSFRNHSEENIQALRNELSNLLNIIDIFDEVNINEKFKIFNSMIEKTFLKNCQVKTKAMETQKLAKPWITPSLRRSVEENTSSIKTH